MTTEGLFIHASERSGHNVQMTEPELIAEAVKLVLVER